MKQQIATDESQSARLIACGVDPSTADMVWQTPITTSQKRIGEKILVLRHHNHQDYVGDVPAWSLGRILALLPPTITTDEDEYGEPIDYDLFIYPSATGKIWSVSYAYTEEGYSDMLYESEDASVIEAVVRMIETIASNKHKLNEIKQWQDSSD